MGIKKESPAGAHQWHPINQLPEDMALDPEDPSNRKFICTP